MIRYFALTILVLQCFQNMAQEWAVDGAEWHYELGNSIVWLKVKGDTTIANQPCREISVFEITGSGAQRDTAVLPSEYTYIADSVVYQYIEGEFRPNWVFKLGVGAPEYMHGKSLFPETCTSRDSSEYNQSRALQFQEINGVRLVFSPNAANDDGWAINGCTERIGGAEFLFNNNWCVIDWDTYIFKCYSDPEIGLYQAHSNCDEITGITEPVGYIRFRVQPNPSSGAVRLQFKQPVDADAAKTVRVFGINGQQIPVSVSQIDGNTLKLQLPQGTAPGMYLLQYQDQTVRLMKE